MEKVQVKHYYEPIENILKKPKQYNEVYLLEFHWFQGVLNQYYFS
jgi:hypothetical protein